MALLIQSILLLCIVFYSHWQQSHNDRLSNVDSRTPASSSGTQTTPPPVATPAEENVYERIRKLAESNNVNEVKNEIHRLLDTTRDARENAANQLGHIQTEAAFEGLKILLGDPDVNVRVRSLQALAYRIEPRREHLVIEFLKRDHLSPRELVLAHSFLAYRSTNEKLKKESLLKVIDFARSGFSTEHYIATSKAAEVGGRSQEVIKLLIEKAQQTKNIQSAEISIGYLARYKDSWLNKNLKHLLKSPFEPIRIAAVRSLRELCPANLWPLLVEQFTVENSLPVLGVIIQEAQQIGGPKAIKFIEMTTKSGRLEHKDIEHARKLIKNTSKTPSRCKDS